MYNCKKGSKYEIFLLSMDFGPRDFMATKFAHYLFCTIVVINLFLVGSTLCHVCVELMF